MKKIITVITIIIFTVTVSSSSFGFPSASAHMNGIDDLAGMKDLMETSLNRRGLKSIPLSKIEKLTKWMDAPVKDIGKYKVQKLSGEILTPLNHGALRHNPVNVQKVFKFKGALNAARMHKLQDLAYNSERAIVDGYKVTPQLRHDAKVILRYIRRYKKFPSRLPAWLDKSGPLIKKIRSLSVSKATSIVRSVKKSTPFAGKAFKVLRISGRVVEYAAIPVVIGLESYSAINTQLELEADLKSGRITYEKYTVENSKNYAKMGGNISYMLATGGFILISNPGGWVIAGIIAGSFVVEYAATFIGEKYGEMKVAEYKADVRNSELYYSLLESDLSVNDMQRAGFTKAEYEALKGYLANRHTLPHSIAIELPPIEKKEFISIEMLDSFNFRIRQ